MLSAGEQRRRPTPDMDTIDIEHLLEAPRMSVNSSVLIDQSHPAPSIGI
jgi:hypothetical protein